MKPASDSRLRRAYRHLSYSLAQHYMHQLCKKLSPEGRKFLEPWLQALTQIAVTAGIPNDRVTSSDRHPATRQDTHNHRVSSDSEPLYAGSVNTTESSRGCASEGNDPSCLARDSDLPALLAQREASPQTKAVILPANHTGHGLNSPMLTVDAHVRNPGKKAAATGFLEFTGAWAGEIRSFPPEQVRGHLQEAARQHLELPQKCPDMANATRIGADNRAVYLIEDDTSGWVTSPENHNQSFHYQLFLADPGSPLVAIHADGHSVPAAGLWPLAQAIQDQIKENIETLPPMAELAKNVIADGSRKESANLTFAQPKIQTQLDPEVLSKEIKNGTVLVLKPCNPITQQPETSALVFSVDHNDPNVKVNIGTEGFVEGRSLRGRRQASVKFSHSIVTHMGEIPVGRARTVVNTVCNTDKAPVINVRVSQKTDDSDAGNWPLAGEQSASIHQGQCRGFNNTLAPISPGVKTSQLDIQVNDQKQSFQIYGTGVEADSPPPLVQHIATMTLPDEYTKMSFNGNNELVTEGRGLGSYFQTEPHFTGQRQIDELEMRTNSDSLLCPGPGGTVITSGQAPSLTQRQRGKIVRQVTGKALSEPEQHLRLRDVGCPAIEGKVVGLLEAKNPAGKWGGVCQSGFGPIEGRLACETLGYPAAGAMTSVACDDDTSRVSTVVSYIRCTASDKALLDCEAISYTGSCESGNVYLACNTQPVTEPALSTSTARFRPSSDCTNFGKVDASSDIYGIVEVRRNETQSWQTACHWFFDGMERRVAARMLGIPLDRVRCSRSPVDKCISEKFDMAFQKLNCRGTEESLYDCPVLGHSFCRDKDDLNPLSAMQCDLQPVGSGCSDGAEDTLHLQLQGIYFHNWQTGETKKIQSLDPELWNVKQYHSPDTNTILTSNGSFVNLLSRNGNAGNFSKPSHSLPLPLIQMRGQPGSHSAFGLTSDEPPELINISANTSENQLTSTNLGRLGLSFALPDQLAVSGNGLIAVGNGHDVSIFAIASKYWHGLEMRPIRQEETDWKVPLIIAAGAVVSSASVTAICLAARKLRCQSNDADVSDRVIEMSEINPAQVAQTQSAIALLPGGTQLMILPPEQLTQFLANFRATGGQLAIEPAPASANSEGREEGDTLLEQQQNGADTSLQVEEINE